LARKQLIATAIG